jgi:hypothetical protein
MRGLTLAKYLIAHRETVFYWQLEQLPGRLKPPLPLKGLALITDWSQGAIAGVIFFNSGALNGFGIGFVFSPPGVLGGRGFGF